jgi:hypothetical protein
MHRARGIVQLPLFTQEVLEKVAGGEETGPAARPRDSLHLLPKLTFGQESPTPRCTCGKETSGIVPILLVARQFTRSCHVSREWLHSITRFFPTGTHLFCLVMRYNDAEMIFTTVQTSRPGLP